MKMSYMYDQEHNIIIDEPHTSMSNLKSAKILPNTLIFHRFSTQLYMIFVCVAKRVHTLYLVTTNPLF